MAFLLNIDKIKRTAQWNCTPSVPTHSFNRRPSRLMEHFKPKSETHLRLMWNSPDQLFLVPALILHRAPDHPWLLSITQPLVTSVTSFVISVAFISRISNRCPRLPPWGLLLTAPRYPLLLPCLIRSLGELNVSG